MPRRVLNWQIIALVGLVYVFSAKGHLEVSDTSFSVQTAESLISYGRLDIPHVDRYTLDGLDGLSYSKYGIGLPLYYLPFVAVAHLLKRGTGLPEDELSEFLISFANIPFALLALFMFATLLGHFGIARSYIMILTLGLALGTLCWRYTGYDFSEMMQMGLLMTAVHGAVCRTTATRISGGVGFAWLILVKIAYMIMLPLLVFYLILEPCERSWRVRIREVVLFTFPIVLALAFLVFLNVARFGSPLETGYGDEVHWFRVARLWHTVPRLLVSLDKGLFVFCPLVAIGLLGSREFIRRRPREAALCAAIILANLVFTGMYVYWKGGWSWGPRYLVPIIPLWLLPAAFWLDRSRHRKRFAFAGLFISACIVGQVPGVLVKDQQIHHIRENMLSAEERPWMLEDYPAAVLLLWHKLSKDTERYHLSEFGMPNDRELDLTSYRSFHGFNLWTEHLARRFDQPELRWLLLLGVSVIGYFAIRVGGLVITEMHNDFNLAQCPETESNTATAKTRV